MEFRNYLGVIHRRYYVFIPIFLAIVAVHFVWVNYGQKPKYVANAHLAVMMPHMSQMAKPISRLGMEIHRLRLAIFLPVDSQNFWSSTSQSLMSVLIVVLRSGR